MTNAPLIALFTTGPDSGPSNLTATAVSSTVIILSWNEIKKEQRNGIITEYCISYKTGSFESAVLVKHSTLELLLDNLSIFTEYNISVRGKTVAGCGKAATVLERTLEEGNMLVEVFLRIRSFVHIRIFNESDLF